MADAIGPRVPPRPGGLYGQDRRKTQSQIRQLQRPRVNLPRGGSGGGPVGIVDLMSTSGSVVPNDSGTEVDWGLVTYNTPQTRHGASGWLTVDGPYLYVTPGWYIPILCVGIGWPEADAPDHVQVYMGGGADNAHQDSEWIPLVADGGNRGVYRWVDRGPTYVDSGEFVAEVGFGPSTTAAFVAFGGAGPRLNWTITKLS